MKEKFHYPDFVTPRAAIVQSLGISEQSSLGVFVLPALW